MFEFLKKRRGREKKNSKKNSKTHTRRSLVVTTAEDTSTLERLLSSRRRSKENFTVLLRADDRVKIHSQTSNDIRNQFSKDQIQRAVDKELLQAFEIKNVICIFLPPIFCSFFFVFAQVSSKKTHAREKKHTTYDAQKDIIIPLFAQYYKHTPRTKTHGREKAGKNNPRFLFLFSLVVSEGVLYTHTSVCA